MQHPKWRTNVCILLTLGIAAACTEATINPIVAPDTAVFAKQKAPIELNANFEELNFFNADGEIIGQNATKGFTQRYPNIITIDGKVVDALLTVDDVQMIRDYSERRDVTITNQLLFVDAYTDINTLWDSLRPADDASWMILRQRVRYQDGIPSFSRFRIEFFLENSITPVTLRNFSLSTYDIDILQYVQVSNATSVTLQNETALGSLLVAPQTIRVFEKNDVPVLNTNTAYWAQFNFNRAQTFSIEQGAFGSGRGVWFYDFDEADWNGTPTTTLEAPQAGSFWNGNGFYQGIPISEQCGIENGAPVNGPYLLWILTATKATNATIAIGSSINQAMSQRRNGSFRYVQTFSSGIFTAPTFVYATHDGTKGNLVISHGCTQSLE
jgi:hypothetical protein